MWWLRIWVNNNLVKRPDAALRRIPRRCDVRKKVRLTPRDLRALPAVFLQGRKNVKFIN
jgi:hypothetical protein